MEIDVPLCPQPIEELLVILGIKEDDAFTFGKGLDHLSPFLGVGNVYNNMNLKAFFILIFLVVGQFEPRSFLRSQYQIKRRLTMIKKLSNDVHNLFAIVWRYYEAIKKI